jgi:hypothetical protein
MNCATDSPLGWEARDTKDGQKITRRGWSFKTCLRQQNS